MRTTRVCNKCFRPQHTYSEIGGQRFTTCIEAENDKIVFTDQWKCGCCKCPTLKESIESSVKDFLEHENWYAYGMPVDDKAVVVTVGPIGEPYDDLLKSFVEKQNFYMVGEFDI